MEHATLGSHRCTASLMLRLLQLSLLALVIAACASGAATNGEPIPVNPLSFDTGTGSEIVDPDAPLITYTAVDGFVPKRMDIEPGTQVRFYNASDETFWPASNIHPTHAILPEFDSKKPMSPGETWGFTFRTRGYWRFHNHLAPELGGLVVVRGGEGGPTSSSDSHLDLRMPEVPFQVPKAIAPRDYVNLFKDDATMVRFIKRYGPEHTVRLLKEGEGFFDVDCHKRAHDLGRAAFQEFGASAFALSGHECHAGAFHGATEALFASRGTANLEEDVSTICAAADSPFFRHQCTHGVGHGLMAWTTYEIHDALRLCDKMPTEVDQASCHSGVFMENVVGGLTGVMGHKTQYLKDGDLHYPCNAIDERYIPACYFYQTSHMLKVFNRDFSRVAQACTDAPESARGHCFQSYGRDVGGVTRKDPMLAIQYCGHATSGPDRVACIEGAVQDRFWEASGSEGALEMCGLLVDPTEQNACYWTIIVRAREILTEEDQFDAFCTQIDPVWRSWCADVRDGR